MEVPAIPTRAPDPGFLSIDALLGPALEQPRGSDLHPLRAEYSTSPALNCAITDRAIESIIGESVKIVQIPGIPGSLWELSRAPAGSKAKLDGSRLMADVPGLYVVACTVPGGWRREIMIAAFAPTVLDAVGYLPEQQLEKRLRLRGIVQDPNATRETVVEGIEGEETDLATVAGYTGKKRNAFKPENYR